MLRVRLGQFVKSALAVLMLAALFIGGGGVALAHAKLVSSNPVDGSKLTTAPTQVTLKFSEELSTDASTVSVKDATGTTVDAGNAAVDKADRTQMTVGLGMLHDGSYTIHWKAVTADDNGVMEGDIRFTVGTDTSGNTVTTMGGGSTLPSTGTPANPWWALVFATAILALGWRLRRRSA
jgi:copper transport protein